MIVRRPDADGAHVGPARALFHAGKVGITDHDQIGVGPYHELRVVTGLVKPGPGIM